MTQYIDKSAIVAEIEKLRMDYGPIFNEYDAGFSEGRISAFDEVFSLFDTLEVKEVDLEEEVDKWYNNKASKEFENILYSDIEKFAKHFFELGLKAQKQ